MKAQKKMFKGIIPPLITPLKTGEKLDEEALERLVEFCVSGGVSGVFAMGTSGEAMEVRTEVWLDTVKATITYAKGRVPVFCGVIDSCTSRVIERIRMAEDAGAENVVVTPPFYLSVCTQDEIVRHYEKIAKATKLNIAVYNIPGMTHANIQPETIKRIADIDSVVMYKDSAANWEQFQRNLFLLEGTKVSLFNGAEELCSAAMIFGADGCVPGLANFFPKLFVDLYNAGVKGDAKKAYELQKRIWEVRKVLFVGKSWMSAMKYIGGVYGFGDGKPAFPVESLSAKEKKGIDAILESFGK
jgi:dihydrodipicolinate synthase/N-acetylneuraminate lyase